MVFFILSSGSSASRGLSSFQGEETDVGACRAAGSRNWARAKLSPTEAKGGVIVDCWLYACAREAGRLPLWIEFLALPVRTEVQIFFSHTLARS